MMPLINRELDLRGFSEPVPVMETQRTIEHLQYGDILLVTTTDPRTLRDLDAFCNLTGNTLLQSTQEDNEYSFLIRKQHNPARQGTSRDSACGNTIAP